MTVRFHSSFKVSSDFFPQPFLSEALLEADMKDFLELIMLPILVADADGFENEHGDDVDFILARNNIKEAFFFLWGISEKKS